MATNLLLTKLHVPAQLRTYVERLRLNQVLAAWPELRLLLVTAPAGYGKTTLLAAWVQREFMAVPPAAGKQVLGWLSLDAGDNIPEQFVRYLVAALNPVLPPAVQSWLAGAQLTAEIAMTAVVNALAQAPEQVFLVLDDYHVIEEPAVHGMVQLLLEHGPANFHCLIATRKTPPLQLGRLRAHQQLVELGAAALRFTAAESRQFFALILADPALSEQKLAWLVERTAGWGAGMQLAAMAVRRDGYDMYAAAPLQRYVADYVISDLLERQPPRLRQFILETAILDELSAPLCLAVTEQADSAAKLATLAQVMPLVTAADPGEAVFRYHAVLREVLSQQLARQYDIDAIAQLHRRAAAWYAQQGAVDAALQHYHLAGDEAGALALLEQELLPMMLRGQIQTAERWLAQLPGQLQLQRPRLALAAAWLSVIEEHSDVGDRFTMARAAVARALPPDTAHHPWQQELVALQAATAWMEGDRATAAAYARTGSAVIAAEQSIALGTCHFVQMMLAFFTAPITRVLEHADAALAAFVQAGYIQGQIAVWRERAARLYQSGQAEAAVLDYERLLAFAQAMAADQSAEIVSVRDAYGRMLYALNEIAAARVQFAASAAIGRAVNDLSLQLRSELWLEICERAQQPQRPPDLTGAEAEDALWQQAHAQRALAVRTALDEARTLRWLNEPDSRRAWQVATASRFNPNAQPRLSYTQMSMFVAYAHAYLASGHSAAPIALAFERWRALLQPAGISLPLEIEFSILAARLAAAQGNHNGAVHAADEALALIRATGYVRFALDRLDDVLGPLLPRCREPLARQLLTSASAAHHELALPQLTDAELRVLRQVALGHSTQAVAAELNLTQHTVKFHLKRIFPKLGVNSRQQAVAKAQAIGLL